MARSDPRHILISIFAVACTNLGERVVDHNPTVNRRGLIYEANSETPFTGTLVVYYSNGQKFMESEYHNGKLHGEMICWFPNGQRQSYCEYRDGKKHGKSISGPNGHKIIEVEYQDDKLVEEKCWAENGQKISEGSFRDNKHHGKWSFWYESGQKKRVAEYRDGAVISSKCWDKNGNPKLFRKKEN